jgi:hypothetical protein
MSGLPMRDPGDVPDAEVFSLSVSPYVGAPPNRRSVASIQAITVGTVRSHVGCTTRNRDHASHAHHNDVGRPSIEGPGPSRAGAACPARESTA